MTRRVEQAVAMFADGPDKARAYNNRANIRCTLGNLGAALGDYDQAIAAYRRSREAELQNGNLVQAAIPAANTAEVLARTGVEGVKVHHLMVLKKTQLASWWREGRVERAREDLAACHRLASLAGQGSAAVESIVEYHLTDMASIADIALAQHGRDDPVADGLPRAAQPREAKLLDRYGIRANLASYHDHNKRTAVPRIVSRLQAAGFVDGHACGRRRESEAERVAFGIGGGDPVAVEITYGTERLAMYLQGVDSVYDLVWNRMGDNVTTYGDVHKETEYEFSKYHFEVANVENLFQHFEDASNECKVCLDAGLPLPAYDQCMIASHAFNVLDARKAISQAQRQNYILKVRELSIGCAKLYKAQEQERNQRVRG